MKHSFFDHFHKSEKFSLVVFKIVTIFEATIMNLS